MCIRDSVASLSFTAKAQKAVQGQFSVKGVLLDSLSNEGEPYSTIRISLKNNPAKPVKLAVTGADGRFDERLAVPGTYLIHFTSVGKSPVQKEFSISANRRNVDLGKILIAEATEMLKGVEVVAQKPLVKAEIDKVTYSIEDDPDSKTNTTLEMLRKVPLVTVDGEDKIQVNGSSKFKVHVNGKPNNMMSNNPTEVLRSMPANSIKSIEVITEPGAKYDAEGVAGILNIITIGAGMEGYTVTLNGGASNTRVYGGGYGTVQSGKFTVTGNYSYNYQGSQKGFEDSYREDFTSQENKFLESHRRSKSYGNFQFGSLEGSYEIDTLNLISFSMNLMTGNFTNKRIGNTQMTNHAGNPVYGYGSLGNNESGFGEVGGNMDYQHSFKKKGELLTFSYRFSHSPNNSEANTDYEDTLNVPYLLQNQYFKNDASTQEHTAQLDYTNPINSIHSIETGIKYIFRRSKSDGKYYLADKTGEYKYDQDMSTQYDHKQDILAAYLGYQLKYKKLGGKAGIRYEHTFMDADYKNKDEKFDAQFDDLVPSLMFSYQLAPTQSLRASYNMRISRPGIWFLNPFTDTSNPTAISYGNPDLEAEKSRSWDAGIEWERGRSFGRVTYFDNRVKNLIDAQPSGRNNDWFYQNISRGDIHGVETEWGYHVSGRLAFKAGHVYLDAKGAMTGKAEARLDNRARNTFSACFLYDDHEKYGWSGSVKSYFLGDYQFDGKDYSYHTLDISARKKWGEKFSATLALYNIFGRKADDLYLGGREWAIGAEMKF